MDKLIDAFCKWEPFGQGLVILLLASIIATGIVKLVELFVVLFRGWPPQSVVEKMKNDQV